MTGAKNLIIDNLHAKAFDKDMDNWTVEHVLFDKHTALDKDETRVITC